MVLTTNQVEVTPKGFLAKREFNSFIILDAKGISYLDEQKVFGYSIEVLNQIRIANNANKMCQNFKSGFRIDTDIYYKVIDRVLKNESFSDAELEKYIESEQQKEDFLFFLKDFSDVDDEFYLPSEVDFILLGIDQNAYDNLDEDQKEKLNDGYGNISYDVRAKKIEIKDFITKAKELISNIKIAS